MNIPNPIEETVTDRYPFNGSVAYLNASRSGRSLVWLTSFLMTLTFIGCSSEDIAPGVVGPPCESEELCDEDITDSSSESLHVKLPCDMDTNTKICAPGLPKVCAIDTLDANGELLSRQRFTRDEEGRIILGETTEGGHTFVTMSTVVDPDTMTALTERPSFNLHHSPNEPPEHTDSHFTESLLNEDMRPIETKSWNESYRRRMIDGEMVIESETQPQWTCDLEYERGSMIKQTCTHDGLDESRVVVKTYDTLGREIASVETLFEDGIESETRGDTRYEFSRDGHLVRYSRHTELVSLSWTAEYTLLDDGRVDFIEYTIAGRSGSHTQVNDFVYDHHSELMKVEQPMRDITRVRHYDCEHL